MHDSVGIIKFHRKICMTNLPSRPLGVGVTTTPRLISHLLRDEYWTVGGTPKPTYVAPWAVYSPRQEDIQPPSNYDEIDDPWQGTLKQSFVDELGIYIQ
jgi:hypothetical protein